MFETDTKVLEYLIKYLNAYGFLGSDNPEIETYIDNVAEWIEENRPKYKLYEERMPIYPAEWVEEK